MLSPVLTTAIQLEEIMPKITALYCRLSHDDEQNGPSGSIRNQQTILERFARENDFHCTRFFIDDGYSGVTFARPAFMEMMTLAEEGQIGTIIVKDHSRLGRNRLIVGRLLEEDFDRMGVRYIAVMDNIDTAKGLSDLVPMQDLFNEWHAKNTSQKVRNVFRSKGLSGAPLTTNPPYGYKKAPDGKGIWVPDEAAAQVVRQIFAWCIEGVGPTLIARRLQEAGIPSPAAYKRAANSDTPEENSPVWCSATVSDILARREYIGDTVNFRSTTKSFKSKKKIVHTPEEWTIFEGTHPAIISKEIFEIVQGLREHRRRPTRGGEVSIFSGLLYCADCGEKLYYSARNNGKREQACFYCSSYRKDSSKCSAHFIRESVLMQHLRLALDSVIREVQCNETAFAEKHRKRLNDENRRQFTAKKKEAQKLQKRIDELDFLFRRIYEDSATGRLSEKRYLRLSAGYEEEQQQLEARLEALEAELLLHTDDLMGLKKFIARCRRVAADEPVALTSELLHGFVEKIIVHAPVADSGERKQQLDIVYYGIGSLSIYI